MPSQRGIFSAASIDLPAMATTSVPIRFQPRPPVMEKLV